MTTYLTFGLSLIITGVAFVGSSHLWKESFFRKCLIAASFSGFAGIILELSDALDQKTGMTVLIMFIPLIYLGYFQLFRLIFKKWKGTEPYITGRTDSIGHQPLDLYTSANKDGKKRKFEKDRLVMPSDFIFSFLQALIPIFTIVVLIALINGKF